MKRFKWLGLLSIGFMLANGHAMMVKSGTEAEDAKAKLFAPDQTQALVYVYRDNSFLGGAVKSEFVVNHTAVATIEKGRYSVIALPPGKYDVLALSSKESNATTMLIHNSKKAGTQLTAEAGQIYYFQVTFKPMGGFSLKAVSAEEAQAVIKKEKLSSQTQL